MRFGNCLAVGAVLAGLIALSPSAAFAYPPIEAEKGKQYTLTKKHGPWMIMVASFSEPPPDVKTEGMTPDEAADELVFDLRKKGIPAYKYAREEVKARLGANDRIGRVRRSAVIAQQGSVCVLAGNYADPENDVAQKTLEYIKDPKRFMPSFLGEAKAVAEAPQNGKISLTVTKTQGRFRTTPGRPSPLSGAFLTLNPMLTPEEAAKRRDDPLVLKLNGSADYSLLQNPGKYTVVIATFAGQSQTQIGRLRMEDSTKKWNHDSLDSAGQNAYELCTALRQGKFNVETDLNKPPRYEPVKAWVYHDRYRSYVTVGEFELDKGEKVNDILRTFGAKERINPATKTPFMAGEKLIIPSQDPKKFPDRMWIFDPQPIVMPVPKIKM